MQALVKQSIETRFVVQMRLWQHFASLLWIGEYAPVPVIYRRFFFVLRKVTQKIAT
jgi:hypothetical protein